MNDEYIFDSDYSLTKANTLKEHPSLPVNKYEHLEGNCAVNVVDWTPSQSTSINIEGQPTCSISLNLDGKGLFSVENEPAVSMTKGSVFIFRTQKTTKGVNQYIAQQRYLVVDFRYPYSLFKAYEKEFLNTGNNQSQSPILFLKREITNNLISVAYDVISCQMHGVARELYLRGKALEVLACIAGDLQQCQPSVAKMSFNKEHITMQGVRKVLDERYTENWTLRSLAQEVGINDRKLKEGFRQILKTSFRRYLEDIRMSHACRLLRNSNLSVTTISTQVGYANSSHFAKVFRERERLTPRQWRLEFNNF